MLRLSITDQDVYGDFTFGQVVDVCQEAFCRAYGISTTKCSNMVKDAKKEDTVFVEGRGGNR